MRPHVSSIANVLAHYGCNDAVFADFISELLQNDPVRRPSAEQSLNHGWLQQSGSGTCTKYCLSSKDCGEAGQRLQSKYPSMNDLDSPSSIQSTTDYLDSDELIGPATPQSFREQCYLDRERGEKKKVDKKWSRKSIGQRLSGSSLSAAVSHRTAPQLSSSTGERCSYTSIVTKRRWRRHLVGHLVTNCHVRCGRRGQFARHGRLARKRRRKQVRQLPWWSLTTCLTAKRGETGEGKG